MQTNIIDIHGYNQAGPSDNAPHLDPRAEVPPHCPHCYDRDIDHNTAGDVLCANCRRVLCPVADLYS